MKLLTTIPSNLLPIESTYSPLRTRTNCANIEQLNDLLAEFTPQRPEFANWQAFQKPCYGCRWQNGLLAGLVHARCQLSQNFGMRYSGRTCEAELATHCGTCL